MSRLEKIEGFESYFISNNGVVYSDKYTERKILSPRANKRGYLYVNLCNNGKYKSISIHRLVAQAFIPNTENKPEVNHINGIKTDNRVENLEWVTKSENIQHAFDNNLNKPHDAKGSKNGFSKLKENQVVEIKTKLINKISVNEIYKQYGVSYECIRNIKRCLSWGHIVI